MTEQIKTYRLIVPAEFVALNLGEGDNLHKYGRECDNYPDADGNIEIGGEWGVKPVSVPPSQVLWIRELKPGTKPEDYSYTGEWTLITVDEFSGKYADNSVQLSPAGFQAGDVVIFRKAYRGTLLRRDQDHHVLGEQWFVDFEDGKYKYESYPASDMVKV